MLLKVDSLLSKPMKRNNIFYGCQGFFIPFLINNGNSLLYKYIRLRFKNYNPWNNTR